MSPFHEASACGARKTTPEAGVSFVVMQKQRLVPCCPHAMSCLWSDKRLEKMGILSDPDRCKVNARILLVILQNSFRWPQKWHVSTLFTTDKTYVVKMCHQVLRCAGIRLGSGYGIIWRLMTVMPPPHPQKDFRDVPAPTPYRTCP